MRLPVYFHACCLLSSIAILTAQRIPEHLVHCYRTTIQQNATNATSAIHHNLPHTLQLFIELVRKIEDANPTSLDMRLLSVNLLHRLRLDGIETASGIRETDRVTPARANGIQVSKYQLLLQLVSDSPMRLDFDQWLTPAELCHLHRMLSVTVEPWERGDEWRVCPLGRTSAERIARPWLKNNHVQDPDRTTSVTVGEQRLSRCPLEGGAVRTGEYGSFSIGTTVASMAAGLQPQRVGIGEFLRARDDFENVMVVADNGGDGGYDGVDDGMDVHVETGVLDALRRGGDAALLPDNAYGRLLGSTDKVDNTYAAGLAGDLAEVCVYQGPYVGENVSIGLEGVWNNTLYPRLRFFPDAGAGRWETTDAEILAGIDGLFLSQQIAAWQRKVRRLRLSQVLDMFYSSRGIPVVGIKLLPSDGAVGDGGSGYSHGRNHLTKRFSTRDDLTSACDRRTVLQLIDLEQLQLETLHMAQLLQYRRSSMAVDDAQLRANCAATVGRFVDYAERLLERQPPCRRVLEHSARPRLDLTLVLDGARSEYEALELVGHLVESMDVSNSGSWMSVINGQLGQYMARRTRSVASVFEQLNNCTGTFPVAMSVSASLQRLSLTLAQQTRQERQRNVLSGEPHVVLIMVQKQRITEADFASAQHMLHDSLLQFPDLYFVFVGSRLTVDQLIELTATVSRFRPEHYKVIVADGDGLSATTFGGELLARVNSIPRRIVAPFCNNGSSTDYGVWFGEGDRSVDDAAGEGGNRFVFFEDYISPYQEHVYRIGPEHLTEATVRLRFRVNYGTVTVCMARELNQQTGTRKCHSIDESGTANFEVDAPCKGSSNALDLDDSQQQTRCSGVYFFVTLDQSLMRCSENRCRYPDQVLLIMQHAGLRCERDDRSSGAVRRSALNGLMSVVVAILAIRLV